MSRRSDLLPSLTIVGAALLWGLFWIPVRGIENAGVDAVWSGVLIFGSGTVVLLPIALWRWRYLKESAARLIWAGVFSGCAFALYTISINLTDVVRVILLFYLTPLWSTILGMVVLRERLTVNRVVALVLALAGLLTVLGVGLRLPLPSNLGDWFALASGMVWSVASVKLFQSEPGYIVEKTFLFVVFALVICLLLVILPLGIQSSPPASGAVGAGGVWILVIAIMMLPLTFMTIWPCTQLSPARVGMLFMFELVVGITSAALLTDEVYGTREQLGTLLIISAGVIEVLRPARSR